MSRFADDETIKHLAQQDAQIKALRVHLDDQIAGNKAMSDMHWRDVAKLRNELEAVRKLNLALTKNAMKLSEEMLRLKALPALLREMGECLLHCYAETDARINKRAAVLAKYKEMTK